MKKINCVRDSNARNECSVKGPLRQRESVAQPRRTFLVFGQPPRIVIFKVFIQNLLCLDI